MKKVLSDLCKVMFSALLLMMLAPGAFAQTFDPGRGIQAWEGTINGKIPVTVWFDVRDGLIAGEIVYLNTKEKQPIALLGQVNWDDGRLEFNEVLPNGVVSGIMLGVIRGNSFSGTWIAPAKTVERGSRYETIDGKSYPLRLTRVDNSGIGFSRYFSWFYDQNPIAGEYRYSWGDNRAEGKMRVTATGRGSIEYEINTHVGAPSFNMADVGPETVTLEKNRVVVELADNCAFEILLFNGFAAIRHIDDKICWGYFGMNANVDGLYLKTVRQ